MMQKISISTGKRVVRGLAAAARVVLVLLPVVMLLALRFINTSGIERKVRDLIAARSGRSVTYGALSIAFFPRPRMTIDAFRLSLPGTASAEISSLRIYPEILPLFIGTVRLAKVSRDRPVLAIDGTAFSPRRPDGRRHDDTASEASGIGTALQELRSFAPNLLWTLNAGEIMLQRPAGKDVAIREVRGSFRLIPKGLDLEVGGTVGRWGRLEIQGRLLAETGDDIAFTSGRLISDHSSVSGLFLGLIRKRDWTIEMKLDQAVLRLEELHRQAAALVPLPRMLPDLQAPQGTITLTRSSFSGLLVRPADGKLSVTGAARDVSFRISGLPDPLRIDRCSFSASTERFTVSGAKLVALDTKLTTTLNAALDFPHVRSADAALDGTAEPGTMTWIASTLSLPTEETIRAPLSISRARLQWARGGRTSAEGVLAIASGPRITVRTYADAGAFVVERLTIDDADSSASLSFALGTNLLDVAFAGELNEATLDRLFVRSDYDHGSVAGDIAVHLDMADPGGSSAQGTLRADNILVPGVLSAPLDVKLAVLRGDGDRIIIGTAEVTAKEQSVALAGSVILSGNGIRFDGDLRSQTLDIGTAVSLFPTHPPDGRQEDSALRGKPAHTPDFSGSLRWNVGLASCGTHTVQPLIAAIELAPGGSISGSPRQRIAESG